MDLLQYDRKDGRVYYSLKEICAHLNRIFELPDQQAIFPYNLSSDKKNKLIDWKNANQITEKEYLNIVGFCYLRYYLCIHPTQLKRVQEHLLKINLGFLTSSGNSERGNFNQLIKLWDLKI